MTVEKFHSSAEIWHELERTRAELATAAADRDAFADERDTARAEVERLTEELKDAAHRVGLLESVAMRWDADCFTLANYVYPDGEPVGLDVKRLIADAAPGFERLLTERVTLSQNLADAHMDVRRAMADATHASDAAATAQAALRMTGTALAEARAERDTAFRLIDAMRAVLAMAYTDGDPE